jgi:hypothetical protein
MRSLFAALISCLLATAPAFAQSDESTTSAGTSGVAQLSRQQDMWMVFLSLLDAPNGLVSYNDVKRVFLINFDCKDEIYGSSLGTKGNDKGIELAGVKSHCRDEAVFEYFGRMDVREGDTPFHYQLNLFLYPTASQCVPADIALKALKDRHWVAQSMLPAYAPPKAPASTSHKMPARPPPPPPLVFDEPMPNTEELKAETGNRFLSIHWVSKEHPQWFMGIDPSKGCLQGLQVTNE